MRSLPVQDSGPVQAPRFTQGLGITTRSGQRTERWVQQREEVKGRLFAPFTAK